MSRIHRSGLLPALLAAAFALLAAGPLAAQAPPDAADALSRALATVSADELAADLHFIASDDMAGRDSPSPELKIAARFLRARLQRLGIQPGGPDGSYFYEWTTPQVGLDRDRCWIELTTGGATTRWEWAKDYFPTWRSAGMREVDGGVMWVGDLSEEVLKLDGLAGNWLVGTSTRGIGRGLNSGLREAGVVGVLVLQQEGAEQSVADALGTIAKRYDTLQMGPGEDRPGYPILYVAEDAAARLRALVPEGAAPGTALDATLRESCAYGKVGEVTLENVVGLWPGSDPELRHELIILSAHYDHVGTSEEGVFNGADDNGSGTCGMLALAEALTEYGPMRRSIMLMWVSAEEKGLMGSAAWTLDPYLPDGLQPICNINIDMIGRNAPDELAITPTSKRPEYSALTKVAEKNAAAEGFGPLKNADAYWRRSDHMNFSVNLKLPVAFLFTDVHEDYHQVTDTPDKIDYDKMRRVVRLVVRMLADLQTDTIDFST